MGYQLIAARSLNNVIGNDFKIPWRAKGEQKLFKEITINSVLIMGRKTYESIGRPLPNRQTIIISRDPLYRQEGCQSATTLEVALELADEHNMPVFVAGGGQIYAQALAGADAVHLTTIQCEVEGNIFFPDFPSTGFELKEEQYFHSNIDYLYQLYKRC